MAVTEYIGSRYVPVFADPSEWNSTRTYEPLTIVQHDGNSFTSKQFVPIGTEITNEIFWVETGNYNAQLESYRKKAQNAAKGFSTVNEMLASSTLSLNDVCVTSGFYNANDGGGGVYLITNENANGYNVLKVNNYLSASLIIFDRLNVKQLGDNSNESDKYLTYAASIAERIFVPQGTYNFSNPAIIKSSNDILFGRAILQPVNKGAIDGIIIEGVKNYHTFYSNNNIIHGSLVMQNFDNAININKNATEDSGSVLGNICDIEFVGNTEHIRCWAVNVYNLNIKNCSLQAGKYGFHWYAPTGTNINANEKISFIDCFSGNLDCIFFCDASVRINCINTSLDYSACAIAGTSAKLMCTNCHIEGIGNADRGSSTSYHGFCNLKEMFSTIISIINSEFIVTNDTDFINTDATFTPSISFINSIFGCVFPASNLKRTYIIGNTPAYLKNCSFFTNLCKCAALIPTGCANPFINDATTFQDIVNKGYSISPSLQYIDEHFSIELDTEDTYAGIPSLKITNKTSSSDTLYITYSLASQSANGYLHLAAKSKYDAHAILHVTNANKDVYYEDISLASTNEWKSAPYFCTTFYNNSSTYVIILSIQLPANASLKLGSFVVNTQ